MGIKARPPKSIKRNIKEQPIRKRSIIRNSLTGSNAFYTKEDFDLKQYCIRLNYCRTNLYQDIRSLRVHLFYVNSVEYSTQALIRFLR